MTFRALLQQNQAAIARNWFSRVLDTYPPDTAGVLKRNKDPFANPVGTTLSRELEAVVEGLVQGLGPDDLRDPVDRIIRIRAVQDFRAAEAVGFLLFLKDVVREELGGEPERLGIASELREFERVVDALALAGFDIYSDCLKALQDIRVREAKDRMHMLLRRANLGG
jgi:hypothetical protein